MAQQQKGRAKVQVLIDIERKIQTKWMQERAFETDATTDTDRQKYFVNSAYPYMNGRLHLGHGFSYSRAEFAVGFRRLLGQHCLWPFGLHGTGMPIKACADKLAREMETFGCPPNFPTADAENTDTKNSDASDPTTIVDKSKSKKSKLVAKTGPAKYQWQIMQSLGLRDDSEIRKFADATYWLKYFPSVTMEDLKLAGYKIDWRRTFITTDINPYYDSFIRWQLTKLKELDYVKFGRRICIYSPASQQPCMDHDRSAGEGVAPQEYTLIKMELVKPYPIVLKSLEASSLPVHLVAATLRPETMYGQTNCWVQPEMKYIVYNAVHTRINSKNQEITTEEIFISTERAASNLSYQLRTKSFGQVDKIESVGENGTIIGSDLVGAKLQSPNTLTFQYIYVLPMMNITKGKGTGIVTSVPSDSPDDYAALQDLKRKPEFCKKYPGIDADTMLLDPVPIIDVPDYGNLSAVAICNELKIKSQNDRDKLQEAKERVYLKGFYEGRLLVGPFKDQKVQDVKKVIQKEMIADGKALLYYEPEKLVVSRSGEECVAALVDQWFLNYGDESWKQRARECLSRMETYSSETRNGLEHCINWLHEWACSRSYGLGTRLPWDETYLIESLSDSTIYMAYYTVAHMLQGNVDGSVPGTLGLRADAITPDVWEYVFLGKQLPDNGSCVVPKAALDAMRHEFLSWYGFDMRCTGKDLINNHLTFTIFNHVAIWPDDTQKWPRAVLCNGHLMLNNEKMSKSTGNFMTFRDSLERFSADGTRFALADAGDSIADANFEETTADSGVLRLYNWLEWVKDLYENVLPRNKLPRRKANRLWIDEVLDNEINIAIGKTYQAYEKMLFKDALKFGFFEMQNALTDYKEIVGGQDNMDADLIDHFVQVQTLLLTPVCPHLCEYLWSEVLLKPQSLMLSGKCWPELSGPVNEQLATERTYLCKTAHDLRVRLQDYLNPKSKKTPKDAKAEVPERPSHATIWVARTEPVWRAVILNTLNSMRTGARELPDNKEVSQVLAKIPELKKYLKRAMPFVVDVKQKFEIVGEDALRTALTFDEKAVLQQNASYLRSTLGVDHLLIHYTSEASADADAAIRDETCPGEPRVVFSLARHVKIECINRQPLKGLFGMCVPLFEHDDHESVVKRLMRQIGVSRLNKASAAGGTSTEAVRLYRFQDVLMGPRCLPIWNQPYQGLEQITNDAKFDFDASHSSGNVGDIRVNGIDAGQTLVYFVE